MRTPRSDGDLLAPISQEGFVQIVQRGLRRRDHGDNGDFVAPDTSADRRMDANQAANELQKRKIWTRRMAWVRDGGAVGAPGGNGIGLRHSLRRSLMPSSSRASELAAAYAV